MKYIYKQATIDGDWKERTVIRCSFYLFGEQGIGGASHRRKVEFLRGRLNGSA